MTYRNTSRRPLTELQQAILEYVWRYGPSTSERIREGLLPRHPLKDSSIRTLLRRLEERGYLTHTTEGTVFVYRATTHKTSVAAKAVKQIIDRSGRDRPSSSSPAWSMRKCSAPGRSGAWPRKS